MMTIRYVHHKNLLNYEIELTLNKKAMNTEACLLVNFSLASMNKYMRAMVAGGCRNRM